MEFIINGLATIIVIISLITILWLQFNISTNLSVKKIIIGGTAGVAAGASMLILGKTPLNGTFIFVVLFIGILSVAFVFGRWTGNKSLGSIYSKYGIISIEDVIITTSINNGFPTQPATTFHQTDRRIYCFVTHNSAIGKYFGETLIIKWNYQNKEFHRSKHSLQLGVPLLSYIQAPENDLFRRGCYTVELIVEPISGLKLKTVEFEIM